MTRILDFDSRFDGRDLGLHAMRNPSSLGDRTPPAAGVVLDVAAVARVDHSRWIADCPFDGCSGAEFVSFAEPVFFCCECRNETTGHVPVSVVMPDAETRAGVEEALLVRPVPDTRNWSPEESVDVLLVENVVHGIEGGG